MILTAHILVGAAIGARIKKLWQVIILAWFASYILDFLPQWRYLGAWEDINFWYVVVGLVDFALGGFLVYLLLVYLDFSKKRNFLIISGAVIALVPKLFQFLGHVFDWKLGKGISWLHDRLYVFPNISFSIGIWMVLLIVLGSFLSVVFLARQKKRG